ncbi:Mitochondrial polypeptide chain release factor [Fasciola hepatica]|uniref:Mitochondrial polypeptide chain release factor n=1 Tax=Fasciola hepatica TaxID=6192 RepID=A0A2H1CAR5_FASHE|nr:Mitochondrial polypeptide chain release factor [Fasciola hepatica]
MLRWSVKSLLPVFRLTKLPIRAEGKLPFETSLFEETDLTEDFVRGWGPGGQAINKTANCVVLRHNPTGLVVKCQDCRDLHRNRIIARRRLHEKLDTYLHGNESEAAQKRELFEARERQRYMRSKRRLEAKWEFKAREGLGTRADESPCDSDHSKIDKNNCPHD